MKTKVFENGTIKECLARCLEEGFVPCNLKRAYEYSKKHHVWVDCRAVFVKGIIRNATMKELRDIESFYKNRGSLLFVDNDGSGLLGDDLLDLSGRFVGVKK